MLYIELTWQSFNIPLKLRTKPTLMTDETSVVSYLVSYVVSYAAGARSMPFVLGRNFCSQNDRQVPNLEKYKKVRRFRWILKYSFMSTNRKYQV